LTPILAALDPGRSDRSADRGFTHLDYHARSDADLREMAFSSAPRGLVIESTPADIIFQNDKLSTLDWDFLAAAEASAGDGANICEGTSPRQHV
jgi:hypothetical protein